MKKRRYKVLGSQAQMIEFADGNDANLPPGTIFEARPSNRSVARLLGMSPPLLIELAPEKAAEPAKPASEPEPKPKPKRKRRTSSD